VVVYKVDRLTRSLADFAKMVELHVGQGPALAAVKSTGIKCSFARNRATG
jgi:DNA invertase Pin-like site-specific DNA recombinase